MKGLLLAAAAVTMSGQALELAVGGGQTRLSNAGLGKLSAASLRKDDYALKGAFRMVFRMTTNSGDHFGHEFGYAYNRTMLQQFGDAGSTSETGMATHQGFYNYLAYATREGSKVRPFATGGVHFNNYVPPGQSATQGGGTTKFGVNYGGGIKFRVSEKWMFRVDARQYINPKPNWLVNPGGWIRMNEVSAAVAFVL